MCPWFEGGSRSGPLGRPRRSTVLETIATSTVGVEVLGKRSCISLKASGMILWPDPISLERSQKQERENPTWDSCPDTVIPLLDMLRGTLLCRRCCCLCMGDRWNWFEEGGAVRGRRDAILAWISACCARRFCSRRSLSRAVPLSILRFVDILGFLQS